MNDLSWAATSRLVHQRADFCCEYCQTRQRVIGQAMHIEHIDPHGGDHPDNLGLACANCNQSKGVATSAVDPVTQTVVPLFNPRQQIWDEHFAWDNEKTRLQGLTPVGRATIERLKINIERMVFARRVWISAGEHPPRENGA